MDKELENKILSRAIRTYGIHSQINVAIEEMSELTKALCKWVRWRDFGGGSEKELIKSIKEEMADVSIMLDQMKILFGDYDEDRNFKLLRLKKRIFHDA